MGLLQTVDHLAARTDQSPEPAHTVAAALARRHYFDERALSDDKAKQAITLGVQGGMAKYLPREPVTTPTPAPQRTQTHGFLGAEIGDYSSWDAMPKNIMQDFKHMGFEKNYCVLSATLSPIAQPPKPICR